MIQHLQIAARRGDHVRTRPSLVVAACAAALNLAATGTPRSALAEPMGVAFLTPTPFAIELAAGEDSKSLSVVVFNGSPEEETITLRTVALSGPDGSPQPTTLVSVSQPQVVTAGDVSEGFTLTAHRPDGLLEALTGTMIATSTDGTMAEAEFSVTVLTGDEPPDPTIAADAMRLPLPEKVVQSAISLVPSPIVGPLRWLSTLQGPLPCVSCFVVEHAVTPVQIPLDDKLAGLASPGILVAADGDIANARLSGRTIEVEGFDGAGTYDGKVSFGDDASTTLSIVVRDFVLWPTLVLFVGLLIAGWIDRRLSRHLPRARLRLALQTLKDEATEEQRRSEDELPRPIYEIWTGNADQWVDEGQGLLAEEAKKALLDFDENSDAAEAAADWSRSGAKFGAIKAITVEYAKLAVAARAVRAAHANLRELVGDQWTDVSSQPVARLAADALGGRLITTVDDLKAAVAALAEAEALLVVYVDSYEVISAWYRDQPDEAKKESLARILVVMTTGRLKTPADVSQLAEEAQDYAPTDYILHRDGIDVRNLDFGKIVDSRDTGDRPPIVVADLTKALDGQEAFANKAAGVLVVLTGLSAIYLSNAAFGSWGDYLTALLWGTVIGTGVTIARRLGPFSAEAVGAWRR